MNLKEYNKFVNITNLLVENKNSNLIFQRYIEENINDNIEFEDFFSKQYEINNKFNKKFYIRLKNPELINCKERGLKICLKNESILKESKLNSGSILFKFKPMLKVIGFSNENCSYCGKVIFNSLSKEEEEKKNDDYDKDNIEIIECNDCKFRKFCSQECKIKGMLEWHDLECKFIKFIQKELILIGDENENQDINNDSNNYIERIILILITTFRLLIKLVRSEFKNLEIVKNMSDHLKLYKKYIKEGKYECKEHEEIFKETKDIFGPLIISYFKKIKNDNKSTKDINQDGICKILFLVFINISSVMDNFNNCFGLMFDPTFSMINHSCKPNCTLIWKDNGEILVKNIYDLKASEEITINYISIKMPKEMREKRLFSSFFFKCECYQCLVIDKEFDKMLPIECNKCKKINFGFKLENFEYIENFSNNKIKICNNCEEIIPIFKIFKKYFKIFEIFKEINKEFKIKKLQDLSNWSIESDNIYKINNKMFNELIKILKNSFNFISIRSWPMNMLLNIIKILYQIREPNNINNLRLTYLTNIVSEYSFEDIEIININIGSTLYDVCVTSADYLFDQYLKKNNNIEDIDEMIKIIGRGTFALCILSFKYLTLRFEEGEGEEKGKDNKLERNQLDLIQLGLEVKKLLEHAEKAKKGSSSCSLYFSEYGQSKFESSLASYERYMDCGYSSAVSVLCQPLGRLEWGYFEVNGVDSVDSVDNSVSGVGGGFVFALEGAET